MYFDLPHGHSNDATPVEQEKSRKLVSVKTTVRLWYLPGIVVKCETAASSSSFGYVEMIQTFP